MFPERGDLQECVLAQVNTVPRRAGESLREQVRAERAPKSAPIPLGPLSPCRPGTPAYRGPTSEARCDRESRLWRPVQDSCMTSRVEGLGETACPSRTVIRSQDPYFRFTPRTPIPRGRALRPSPGRSVGSPAEDALVGILWGHRGPGRRRKPCQPSTPGSLAVKAGLDYLQ